MKNLAAKRREIAKPYASWEDPDSGWNFWLLKSYQADNSKSYARWFVWVEGAFNEYGDEYVLNLRSSLLAAYKAKTITVDTSIWANDYEFMIWSRA